MKISMVSIRYGCGLVIGEMFGLVLYILPQNLSPGFMNKVLTQSTLGDPLEGGSDGHVIVIA